MSKTSTYLISGAISFVLSNAALADDSWRDAALKAVRAEPSVVEAIFPNNAANSFWASMRDDGSRRDGMAEYLCMTLRENGMPKGSMLVIHIWDAAAMAKGDFKELGRTNCSVR